MELLYGVIQVKLSLGGEHFLMPGVGGGWGNIISFCTQFLAFSNNNSDSKFARFCPFSPDFARSHTDSTFHSLHFCYIRIL